MNTNANQTRIDDLFVRAIELPPDERESFLSSNCNGDVEVLAEVQELLAAHERRQRAPEFLASSPVDQQPSENDVDDSDDPLIGQHIGPYEVEKRLGGGGFGDVYLARRTKEFKQTVAIKVVQDDVRNLPRFNQERQVLADLQHEHIARLLDGGTLPDGRPYIVMEYVDGQIITQYCDEHRLSVKRRLALFKQVCSAAAFAHRYGVIHRDIKPLNIMVNNQGVVKLLDFGIAKLLSTPARQPTPAERQSPHHFPAHDVETVTFARDGSAPDALRTALGAIGPMSPPYASPEQARGKEVSTASDIYSLGVVLYELLTGRRPYEFRRFDFEEVQRVICEQQPPKPSAVVMKALSIRGTDGIVHIQSAEALASPRGANPRKLKKTLKGDLEAIILRALAKKQTERYQTVEKLSDELGNFEQGLPVDARPIGRRQRTARWMRRNKIVTALAAVTFITLVGGTIASTLFALRAHDQAVEAERREIDTRAILKFVDQRIFAAARPAGQEGGLGPDVTLRAAIESAMPFVDSSFENQPFIEARLRWTVGTSFLYMGDEQAAEEQFEIAKQELGRAAQAMTPSLMDILMQKEVVTKHSAMLANNLADIYHSQGRYAEELKLREETFALLNAKYGAEHIDTFESKFKLAIAYHSSDRLDEAILIYEEVLAAMREEWGADDSGTLGSMGELATAYYAVGRIDEALQLFEEALPAMRKNLGRENAATQQTTLAIAWILATAPSHELRNGRRALELATEACELTDYKNAEVLNTLAAACAETGDFESAVKWSEKSLELVGEKGDPAIREQFSHALALYKDKKPMRQELPASSADKPQSELRRETTESPAELPKENDVEPATARNK